MRRIRRILAIVASVTVTALAVAVSLGIYAVPLWPLVTASCLACLGAAASAYWARRDSLHLFEEMGKRLNYRNFQLQLLRRQKKNTEAILYGIRDAVLVVDACDRVVIANDAAKALFDFDTHAQRPETIDRLIKQPDFVRLVLDSREKKLKHVNKELVFSHQETRQILDCMVSCIEDDNGRFCGVVCVLHDITREKEMSQMKTDFVSLVSHELKTPLAAINAYAEMIGDGEAKDFETVNQFCNIIQHQAARLNRLIEDILHLSRIESELVDVQKKAVDLNQLIAESVDGLTGYAHERQIQIQYDPPSESVRVLADRDMISQVVMNLLSNAIKYSKEQGRVTLEIQSNRQQGLACVSVRDEGLGIAPENLEHVFEKFYRVEATKKHAEGTGLGLNLVKQIVEKFHDGRVFATSTLGEGSTFSFELPLAEEPAVEEFLWETQNA